MKTFFLALVVIFAISRVDCLEDDSKTCTACNKFFALVSNVSRADSSVHDSLVKLCTDYSFLPGEQTKKWCQKGVERFSALLNKHLNTSTVCYDIKACHDDSDDGIREIFTYNKNTDCEFCTYVTDKVKEIIVGGPTELEIKSNFEDACHYLGSFENECLNYVDQYVDTLFAFINETFKPDDLCKSLRLCTKKTSPMLFTSFYPTASQLVNILPLNISLSTDVKSETTTNVSNALNCDICKKLVKIIQRQLQDNATDEQIIHVLAEVCQVLPRSEKSQCTNVVTDYARQLIQVLTQDVDSSMACTLAGLCVPSNFWNYLNGYYLKQKETQKSNVLCVECQLIAHYVQNELYNYKNEEQIEQFIQNHLCKKISLLINESNCNTFIEQYGPIIMQTIAQEMFDPSTLCFKEIAVCHKPKNNNKINKDKMVEDITFTGQKEKCTMCQDIVKSLNTVQTVDNVEMDHLIEKACDKLARPLRVECGLMMKAFGPYFFEMLDRYSNANEVCRSVDICMVPGRVHLLGGHKCTYGPSYWCHTAAHAKACSAYDYCVQKVWKAVE